MKDGVKFYPRIFLNEALVHKRLIVLLHLSNFRSLSLKEIWGR